ncbi:MAG: heme o synthase [Halobacteriota archaeon]
MASTDSPDRVTALLAATAMGVYLLLLVGATTSLTDAAASCAAWPACGDGWTVPATTNGYIAVGHRVVAAIVGIAILVLAVLARRVQDTRVRRTIWIAALLYPAQAALGAVVALSGESMALSMVHLAIGVTIFGGLVLALAWTLERQTGDADDRPTAPPEMAAEPTRENRPPVPTAPRARLKATASAYFRLMKPRLMWLLCLVAAAGMGLAGGPNLTASTIIATLGGGVLSIGASGTFNHVLERDVDRRMARTSDRPLATDLVPVRRALAFGFVLTLASLALFVSVNLLVAVLGLVAIVFYSVVYTLILKPNTVQNTVIGGAAGALPALIGWVAVTGEVGLGGIALGVLIFLWTPAHFYNLALAYKDDYARGGFPMMPLVRGDTVTRKHILWYLGATLVAAAALGLSDGLGWLYVGAGALLGGVFLWTVVRLHYEQTERAAFRAFFASNAYLGVVLLAIVVDTFAI